MDYNHDSRNSYGQNSGMYYGNGGRNPRKRRRRSPNIVIIIIFVVVIAAALTFGIYQIISNIASPATDPALTTVPPTSNPSQSSASSNTSSSPSGSGISTDPSTFITPNIQDDNTDGYMSDSIYIYKNVGFELFFGDEDSGAEYARQISNFKNQLGNGIKVYNLVVPTAVEFQLPRRIRDEKCYSQKDCMESIFKSYTSDVQPINVYNYMASHNSEYLYYRTDHHWTALGAYYAYSAFCDATSQKALALSDCEKKSIPDFGGSYLTETSDSSLQNSLDTVDYYKLPNNVTCYNSDGVETTMYYELATGGSNTYGVFIWGDTPKFIMKSDAKGGKKIAVVKESYGNAMMPYLAANYSEVHVIDFRHFEGKLSEYCAQNGITEVLFMNGVMSANTASQMDSMATLFN